MFIHEVFGMTMITPLLGRFVVKRPDFVLTYTLIEYS
jgi:hypothetical protein